MVKKEDNTAQNSEDRGKKNSVRSTPANTKGREAFEGDAQGAQRCFPAAHEDHTGTDIHIANCGGPTADSDGLALTELQPVGTTHCGAGKKREKEVVALTTTYSPCATWGAGGRGVGNEGKDDLGEKGKIGGRYSSFAFVSCHLTP